MAAEVSGCSGRRPCRAEGRLEVNLEFAKAMIADGEPIDKIVKYTGLNDAEVEQLAGLQTV